jgi:hypothetical protein
MRYFEKLQFALMYSLFKSKYFKAGGGYRYRANQFLSFSISLFFVFVIKLFSSNELSNNSIALFFFAFSSVFFFILEKNTTKRKMIKYRYLYINPKKNLIPFFILWISIFTVLLLSLKCL